MVGNQHFYGDELSRSLTVKDGTGPYHVRAGEYRIAVSYNGTWLYSDVFTVSYAGTPQATVSNQTVSGTRNETLNSVEVNISLTFDTLQNVAVDDDVKSWFTNLPAGLTAVINFVSSDMKFVSITISGTPTKAKNEAMAITIPAGKLTSGAALTVTPNDNARFEIAQSENALTDLSAAVNLEALMDYDSITTTVPEADRDKYDIIVLGVKLDGTELGTANVADPGEQLTLTVGVAAKAPYLLTVDDLESLNVQVGGHGAGPVKYYGSGGYGYYSEKVNDVWYWKFSVSGTFAVPAYTFSNITFTIDPAETGTSPSSTVAVQNGTEAPGSKLNYAVEWTDLGTSGTDSTAMSASSTFQAGHYYECRVKFTSSDKTNYQFPGVGGMTITANGTAIQETTNPNEQWAVSCFAYEYDPGSSSYCYTAYLRYGLGTGSTVSGTVTSYGSASEAVTVTLLQGTSEVATKTLTGASGTVPYSQSYAFPAVPAGEYTLKVEKKGHAPWTESITVDSAAIAKDVTVYLWGDVNRDGDVTAADAQEIQRKAAKLSSAYDTEPNKSYWILRADVNRDGDVTAADAQEIQRKAAKLSSAIDSLP